jgi:hypothetical protein
MAVQGKGITDGRRHAVGAGGVRVAQADAQSYLVRGAVVQSGQDSGVFGQGQSAVREDADFMLSGTEEVLPCFREDAVAVWVDGPNFVGA